jgi:hypothetical protein
MGACGFDRRPDIPVAIFLSVISMRPKPNCHVDEQDDESNL